MARPFIGEISELQFTISHKWDEDKKWTLFLPVARSVGRSVGRTTRAHDTIVSVGVDPQGEAVVGSASTFMPASQTRVSIMLMLGIGNNE